MNLVLGDGRSLGLTIRGGAEYGLGIYITGVDPGSEAESSGLKVRRTGPARMRGPGEGGVCAESCLQLSLIRLQRANSTHLRTGSSCGALPRLLYLRVTA